MNFLNQTNSIDSTNSANYIEDFLDYVENLPEDLQRNITTMRELDIKYQELMNSLENYYSSISGSTDYALKKKSLQQVKRLLIKSQEIGDEKLQLVQQIADLIENKTRQLDLDYKNLGLKPNSGKDQENTEPAKPEIPPERSSKRPRRQRADTSACGLESLHDKNEERQASSSKKNKKKKRKSKAEKERDADSPVEQPIDPDEPTYCLCQQISYGEMIGCDNDRCAIEWFHFSCVGLSTKPKGKWFCPKCRGDRPNVMKPRT
ncbi:PHD finger protein ing1 [Chamberlinius hualienensis]